MNQLINLPCPDCETILSIEIAQPDIFNSQTSSVMVITHEHATTCTGCFKDWVIVLGGAGQFAFGLVPYVAPSKLVLPNGN